MRIQFKGYIFSLLITVVCIVTSLLLTLLKDLFVPKWFDYLIAITIGLFASSLLIAVMALINLIQTRKENARKNAIDLNLLQTEYSIINILLLHFFDDAGTFIIPMEHRNTIESSLARLDEVSTRIYYSEKVSPLKFVFREKHQKLCSTLAFNEYLFFKTFHQFMSNCHVAYHSFRIIPYVKEKPSELKIDDEYKDSLQKVIDATDDKSDFVILLKSYQQVLFKLLKIAEVNENEASEQKPINVSGE